jgi:hypothetical protein
MRQIYEFHAPPDLEKSGVATLRSRNSQNPALLGGFIDSKAHVGSNLQKRILETNKLRIAQASSNVTIEQCPS